MVVNKENYRSDFESEKVKVEDEENN